MLTFLFFSTLSSPVALSPPGCTPEVILVMTSRSMSMATHTMERGRTATRHHQSVRELTTSYASPLPGGDGSPDPP